MAHVSVPAVELRTRSVVTSHADARTLIGALNNSRLRIANEQEVSSILRITPNGLPLAIWHGPHVTMPPAGQSFKDANRKDNGAYFVYTDPLTGDIYRTSIPEHAYDENGDSFNVREATGRILLGGHLGARWQPNLAFEKVGNEWVLDSKATLPVIFSLLLPPEGWYAIKASENCQSGAYVFGFPVLEMTRLEGDPGEFASGESADDVPSHKEALLRQNAVFIRTYDIGGWDAAKTGYTGLLLKEGDCRIHYTLEFDYRRHIIIGEPPSRKHEALAFAGGY